MQKHSFGQLISDWCCIIAMVVAIFSVVIAFSGCHFTNHQEVEVENPIKRGSDDDADRMRTKHQHDQ